MSTGSAVIDHEVGRQSWISLMSGRLRQLVYSKGVKLHKTCNSCISRNLGLSQDEIVTHEMLPGSLDQLMDKGKYYRKIFPTSNGSWFSMISLSTRKVTQRKGHRMKLSHIEALFEYDQFIKKRKLKGAQDKDFHVTLFQLLLIS